MRKLETRPTATPGFPYSRNEALCLKFLNQLIGSAAYTVGDNAVSLSYFWYGIAVLFPLYVLLPSFTEQRKRNFQQGANPNLEWMFESRAWSEDFFQGFSGHNLLGTPCGLRTSSDIYPLGSQYMASGYHIHTKPVMRQTLKKAERSLFSTHSVRLRCTAAPASKAVAVAIREGCERIRYWYSLICNYQACPHLTRTPTADDPATI